VSPENSKKRFTAKSHNMRPALFGAKLPQNYFDAEITFTYNNAKLFVTHIDNVKALFLAWAPTWEAKAMLVSASVSLIPVRQSNGVTFARITRRLGMASPELSAVSSERQSD
jgi:hypothetical protein